MSTFGQQKLYNFRKQVFPEILSSLSNLLELEEKKGNNKDDKIYKYTKLILDKINKNKLESILDLANNEISTFLDVDFIKQYIKDSNDKENKNALAIQLLFVLSALGLNDNLKIYTKEEILLILEGGGEDIFNDIIFIATLGSFLKDDIDKDVASALLKTLPMIKNSEDVKAVYFWDDAFIFSMILHVTWKSFGYLKVVDRQFLLQNYYYQSIIAGVPVRFWIKEFLSGKTDRDFGLMSQNIVKDIDRSKESVIIYANDNRGRLFSSLVREFMPKVNSNGVVELELEKMIKKIYSGKEDGDLLSIWLRESLSILMHIKKGDIELVSSF